MSQAPSEARRNKGPTSTRRDFRPGFMGKKKLSQRSENLTRYSLQIIFYISICMTPIHLDILDADARASKVDAKYRKVQEIKNSPYKLPPGLATLDIFTGDRLLVYQHLRTRMRGRQAWGELQYHFFRVAKGL